MVSGMADKKKPGRFTIQFNLKDPQQRKAAGFLEHQGRYKAHFIAAAILQYEQRGGGDVYGGVDKDQIKNILLELLRTDPDVLTALTDTLYAPEEENKPLSTEETLRPDGDRTFAAISNTLAAFQRE